MGADNRILFCSKSKDRIMSLKEFIEKGGDKNKVMYYDLPEVVRVGDVFCIRLDTRKTSYDDVADLVWSESVDVLQDVVAFYRYDYDAEIKAYKGLNIDDPEYVADYYDMTIHVLEFEGFALKPLMQYFWEEVKPDEVLRNTCKGGCV